MDLLPARTLSLHWGQSVAYQMLLIFPLLGKKSKKARLLFSYDDNWWSMQVLQLYFLIEQIWLTLCQLQNPRDKSKKKKWNYDEEYLFARKPDTDCSYSWLI